MKYLQYLVSAFLFISLSCAANVHAKKKRPQLNGKIAPKVSSAKIASQAFLMKKVMAEVRQVLGKKAVRKLERAKNGKARLRVMKILDKKCAGQCSLLASTVQRLSVSKATAKLAAKNNNCGPYHCLSQWGCHIPCKGLPEGDCGGGGKGNEDCGTAHPDCSGKGKLASRACIKCLADVEESVKAP